MMIEVTSGSVVAVDTESLRAVAARLDESAERLRGAARSALQAAVLLGADPDVGWHRAYDLRDDAARVTGHLEADASRLRHAADRYEFADLRFRWAVLTTCPIAYRGGGGRLGTHAGAERDEELSGIRLRWQELARANPEALAESNALWESWRETAGAEGIDTWADALDGLPLPPVVGVPSPDYGETLGDDAKGIIAALALGVVPATAKLTGSGDPVLTRPQALPADTTAPRSLQQAAERIPDGATDARIRVETYRMPDGGREHMVYLAGTQGGGDDAWDMGSNVDLYGNRRSASFTGVEQALRQAGVAPGEPVHGLGFSQGGMVAARLATEGDYDVRSLISFGSPVDVSGLGDDVLQVSVRHTDDLVPALANGGNPSEGVLVTATHDPGGGIRDLLAPAHRLDAYAETAAEIDASADPRLQGVGTLLERLSGATGVDAVEFSVTRER